jgi:tetratricopeptide (TPR) repeat protein
MPDSRPKELIHAEELMYEGKLERTLNLITSFEKEGKKSSKEQLWILLLRGWVYALREQINSAIEVGESTYQMSKELKLVPEAIEALLLKVYCVFLGKFEEANSYILEAERLLSIHHEIPPDKYKTHILLLKTWICWIKADYDKALNLAKEGLASAEKTERNIHIGLCLRVICVIYFSKADNEKAKEYGMKTLDFMRSINFQTGIVLGLQELGQVFLNTGNLNKALELLKESLAMTVISDWVKVRSLSLLGEIYQYKGLLDKALENCKQELKLARKISHFFFMGASLIAIGMIYRKKGNFDKTKQYFEQGIIHFEESGLVMGKLYPTLYLLLVTLDINSKEQAKHYLSQLELIHKQLGQKISKQAYHLGKSFMLRSSNRMRDNAKAEELLKQIVEGEFLYQEFHVLALISLCELYLDELAFNNNQDIIKEIKPLLAQLRDMGERQKSFFWQAEGMVLQAKLALIQMDLSKAKVLLAQAQQIAEEHGLNLLARKISSEHDNLLEKTDEWDKLKEEDSPMSKRIELASFEGVINRLQGKQAIDPPDLVDEEPTLILIIDEGGSLLFSYKFVEDFSYEEDVISGFLTAFTTFSGELFSKGLDRAKFGEDTILMQSVGQFSMCYLFKGQTYPAMQKLSLFAKQIKNSVSILDILDKFSKSSQVLELKDDPSLESLITEIFVRNN